MVTTKIKNVSEVAVDDHGYPYVDLELEDGTAGYYPNTNEFLNSLSKGDEVKYAGVKNFAGRLKINGLTKLNETKKMVTGIIKSVGEIKTGNNNTFYVELETADDQKAFHFSESYKELKSFKVGSIVQYTDIKEVKDKGLFFVGLSKVPMYSPDERRQLSIVRQSSIKAAVEILSIASPKGRWINSDGSVDIESAISDVIKISEGLIDYAMVD